MRILITGTSKGIGKFLSEYYVTKGYTVLGVSRNDVSHGYNYYHFTADVSKEDEMKSVFSHAGDIDVLINNAGIASMNHSMLMPINMVKNILDVNVLGTFICSRLGAKLMKNKGGRIINFASFAVPFKLEGEAIYAASKAAVISLTEVLSKEYANWGITVNAVAPPATETDLIKNVPKEIMDRLIQRQTIHRHGKMEEIAKVCDFFIDNPMITGETIYMGGI